MTKHYLIWVEERHSIGIAAIDIQHREIAELVNLIVDDLVKGVPFETLKKMLFDLVHFVRVHFAYEERLMAEHGYPEIESHVEDHNRLIQQLSNIIEKDSCVAHKAVLAPAFLIDWIELHALQDDMKLGKYLVSKGLS
jgi:hemerythrin